MRRLLSEPLLHFLLLGGALFGVHAAVTPDRGADTIAVSADRIEQMATAFAEVWRRPPTEEELTGLIDRYVEEEILVREAVKLGLDRDDSVIRRRLEAKILFMADKAGPAAEPSEAALRAYFVGNPTMFGEDPRFSFRQVFLDSDRGDRLEEDAADLLAQLAAAGPLAGESTMGDEPIGPRTVVNEPRRTLALQFGRDFADQLGRVELGVWTGPIRSAEGAHLVLMTGRTEGTMPPFEEVRTRVKHALLAARRTQVAREFIESLRSKYEILIEQPPNLAGAAEAPVP